MLTELLACIVLGAIIGAVAMVGILVVLAAVGGSN